MTWWIRTAGNCVWGSGLVPAVLTPGLQGGPHFVQSLNGHLSGFVLSGEVLNLGPLRPGQPFPVVPYSPLRMLLEFNDAGGLVLREDREPGVTGPRCPDQNYCPAPLVLERAD